MLFKVGDIIEPANKQFTGEILGIEKGRYIVRWSDIHQPEGNGYPYAQKHIEQDFRLVSKLHRILE